MWTTIESLIVGLAITALQMVIKNPKSAAKEAQIVENIASVATQADAAVRGGTWSYTPAPPVAV